VPRGVRWRDAERAEEAIMSYHTVMQLWKLAKLGNKIVEKIKEEKAKREHAKWEEAKKRQ
jgi:hypothetical protein